MFPHVFPEAAGPVPWLTTDQMVEVDRLMIHEAGISLLQMMENAGRALATVARPRLGGDPRGCRVAVLAGSGGNGGGALVAARRLSGWGAHIEAFVTDSEPSEVNAHQRRALAGAGVEVSHSRPSGTYDLVLDGVIGYSLAGPPRGSARTLLESVHGSVVALDVPSGLHATTGDRPGVALRADATVTLALPKVGLRAQPEWVGDLFLADISVPPALYARLGVEVGPIFAKGDIVRL